MDKSKAPQEQGVLNLGKNCFYCDQLDFLPFTCQYCRKVFCSNHRTEDSHKCTASSSNSVSASYRTPKNGPTAASLFPDRDADRKRVNTLLEHSPGPSARKSVALLRLKKFLNISSSKSNKPEKSISTTLGSVFGSKSKLTTKSKTVDVFTLKKSAKGDSKITATDRIYLWCLYISGDTDIAKLDMDKNRKPVFVSNKWPVGRALDLMADSLAISNFNNSTRDSDNRLNIFSLKDGVPQLVEPSERTNNAFKTGETIYLVKGSIE